MAMLCLPMKWMLMQMKKFPNNHQLLSNSKNRLTFMKLCMFK
uniref:Alternative protein DNAH11 n=1 Tax=Homo sapiens TaxID=9606 RepID=L0R5A4_HUMAN|nr:alternative protein DNAH11 [Homo sapiens]